MARRKTETQFITGVDVGSTAIRLATGQLIISPQGEPTLQIIGVVEVPSDGIQKGMITSIEDTVSAISGALEKLEQLVGVPVEHVWTGVSAPQIICQESRGVIAVSRTNGEISEEDVGRAVEAAKTVASPLNYEVLHVLPRSFSVDGQMGIKDPVGMTGIRLEVDTKIIYGPTSYIKNLTKAVYRVGLDIDDFVLTTLAAAELVTSNRQKELGVVVVNIGGPTTNVVVYQEGDMVHTGVIPIGSAHITNDIALGLKTSIENAEMIKATYGECVSRGISKKEMIQLSGIEGLEDISRQYLAEIIDARVTEILERVNQELEKVHVSGLLPAGAVFIGGGAKIRELTVSAREHLQLPAAIGRPLDVGGIVDDADDPAFIPVVGIVKWGSMLYEAGSKKRFSFNGAKVMEKFHKVIKAFIP